VHFLHPQAPEATNLLQRLNEEIKRRTHVVRIFPNVESCLRPVRALGVELRESWLEAHRYLNMDDLRQHKKGGPAHGGPAPRPARWTTLRGAHNGPPPQL
jgi:transposase-like protein